MWRIEACVFFVLGGIGSAVDIARDYLKRARLSILRK
jgi:hypothetical protein